MRWLQKTWHNLPILYKGVTVIALPILCLTAVLPWLATLQRNLAEAQARVAHTQRVSLEARRLLSALVDAETGSRGFVITGREDYLAPYEEARETIPASLATLRDLVADNPAQGERVRALDVLALRQLEIIERTVQVSAQRLDGAGASARVGTLERLFDQGKAVTDALRSELGTFIEEEERLLAARNGVLARQQRITTLTIWAELLIGVAGGLAAAWLFSSGVARRLTLLEVNARRLESGASPDETPSGRDEISLLSHKLGSVERNVQMLRELERLKTDLIATVSHELRTPLTSVRSYLELLLKRELDEETRRRLLGVVSGEVARLSTLINDFLDLQRIESGLQTYTFQTVAVEPLVAEVVALFSRRSERHTFSLSLPKGLPDLRADPDRLHQALSNLLSNAVKYSPAGGVVEVRVRALPGRLEITVRDEGVGMSAATQKDVFTRFFRAQTPEVRGIGGTGLGLALVKEIVEAHGGAVSVESRLGVGSTFSLTLPVVVPEPQPTLHAAGPGGEGAAKGVVVHRG